MMTTRNMENSAFIRLYFSRFFAINKYRCLAGNGQPPGVTRYHQCSVPLTDILICECSSSRDTDNLILPWGM